MRPCTLAGVCSGCLWIEAPYAEQLERKRAHLLKNWGDAGLPIPAQPLEIRSIDDAGLRDRADLTLWRVNGSLRLGLYAIDRRELLHFEDCPQYSPALLEWFLEFRQDLPPVEFGSLRLRVSPTGERGVWLDFPNETVRVLLEQGEWLERLIGRAQVEIGQRHKTLQFVEGRLSLNKELELRPWFQTYVGPEQRPVPLYCTVGSFTQVGFRANQMLVSSLLEQLPQQPVQRWLELGAGCGNFTLPLAARGAPVTALELSPSAIEGLERAAREANLDSLVNGVVGNFLRLDRGLVEQLAAHDAVLVDPPRSGFGVVGQALAQLEPADRPAHFMYVSCFPESMAQDVAGLYELGYRLKNMVGVDQFPQSPHCEWIAALERREA